jgi:hypothetical protein
MRPIGVEVGALAGDQGVLDAVVLEEKCPEDHVEPFLAVVPGRRGCGATGIDGDAQGFDGR